MCYQAFSYPASFVMLVQTVYIHSLSLSQKVSEHLALLLWSCVRVCVLASNRSFYSSRHPGHPAVSVMIIQLYCTV